MRSPLLWPRVLALDRCRDPWIGSDHLAAPYPYSPELTTKIKKENYQWREK